MDDLIIKLSADTAEMKRGLDNATRSVQDSARYMDASFSSTNTLVNTFGSNIAAAAAMSASAVSEIKQSADTTAASIKAITSVMNEAGNAIRFAAGPEAARQMDTITAKTEEFVGTRLGIAAIGIVLGTVAATAATVGYVAYKAGGFLKGLITGDTYKSDNIDALIATNKVVLDLQESLQLTATDANALNDALQRLGVEKSTVTDVAEKVTSKIRGGDTEELDRLGVVYKKTNGQILDTTTVLENAKRKLDEYTEGWDRNQAATAMGLGSYAQITGYLKVNQTEVQKSKDRLNEYNLSVGPETQKYVTEYQDSMLKFRNETRLMGEGFKRVYADQVMPAYSLWANTWAEGWPSMVNGTRHVLAAFTSLGYGVKMSFDIIYDTTAGIVRALGGGFGAVGAATTFAMQGQFTAAKDVLIAGWNDSAGQIKGIGDRIVSDAKNNLKAMQLAQGLFNKDSVPAMVTGKKIGKTWKPKPGDSSETGDATEKTGLDAIAKTIEALKFEQQQLERTDEQRRLYDELKKAGTTLDTPAGKRIQEAVFAIFARKDQIDTAKKQITEFVKNAWDAAADDLDAEDFRRNTTKKMGLLTGKLGLPKNGKVTLDSFQLKSLEQIQDERNTTKKMGLLTGKLGLPKNVKVTLGSFQLKSLEQIQDEQNAAKALAEVNENRLQAAVALAGMNGEWDKMRRLEIELLTVEVERARLSGKLYDVPMLQARRKEIEALASGPSGSMQAGIDAMVKQYGDSAKRMEEIGRTTAESLHDSFSDLFFDGMQGKFKNLSEYFNSFLASVQRKIADLVADQAVQSLLGSGSGGGGGGSGFSLLGYVGGLVSDMFRADGGPVAGGTSYIVGEKGPELFTPGSSGHITPNLALASGKPGITQHITIDARGADSGVLQRIDAAMRQAKDEAVAAVYSSMQRGGQFAVASGRR